MTNHDPQGQATEYDSPWKEILKIYFKEFLEFYLPVAYDGINWQRDPEFLDKELDKITKEAKAGNRRVDLLVKVWLLNGDELWILIHVEIQGYRDPDFAERMIICHHRAFDLHRRPVVGLAILADEDASWRVAEYRQEMFGTKIIYQFNSVKLLDYLDHCSDLEMSDNPFAIVTLAHLRAKQTKNKPEVRYREKRMITRHLYQRGFKRQAIIDLYRFIDWVLSLPPELDDQFWEELSNFEENQKMPYITSVERIGFRKGKLEGRADTLLQLLQERFGLVPEPIREKITTADLDELTSWISRILKADSLQAVFQ